MRSQFLVPFFGAPAKLRANTATTMRRKVTPAHVVAAALLYAEGAPQTAIAKTLGLSASVVARMLATGRGRYFSERVDLLEAYIEAELRREAEGLLSRSTITEALDRHAREHADVAGPRVRVFEGSRTSSDALVGFATAVAPHVRTLLDTATICGVTWGRMLMSVIHALKDSSERAGATRMTEVIPLAGEPMGNEPTKSSSSTLASELTRALGHDTQRTKSLTMVPAIIPKEFSKNERKVIARLMAHSPGYEAIFARSAKKTRDTALVDRLDCVLTSVGHKPLGFQFGSVIDAHEQDWFVGDIGGVLLEKPALTANSRRSADLVVDRWTGLTGEKLLACATRTRSAGLDGPPGVVVISREATRARAVLAAVGRGYVNTLLIDPELERALADLLSAGAA